MRIAQSLRSARRSVAVVAGLAVSLGAPASAAGAGATYTVVQCAAANRGAADVLLRDAPAYSANNRCADAGHFAVELSNVSSANHGTKATARWPVGSSGLGIVGVDVSAKLRRGGGHVALLSIADGKGRPVARVGSGTTEPTPYKHYRWHTDAHGQRQFVASLGCERAGGCPESKKAKTWVRGIRITVADYADPTLPSVDGSLLDGGWRRGGQDVGAEGADVGSGVRAVVAIVNGRRIARQDGSCAGIAGTALAQRFAACSSQTSLSQTAVDTTQAPFHDGDNSFSLCAIDFAGNRTCEQRTVQVDNTPPSLAFTNSQEPSDPELIKAPASDATSGIASGQIYYRALGASTWHPLTTQVQGGAIEARVDSESVPAGQYEFYAVATDRAGNVTQSSLRQDGQPMVLTFPLKSGVHLSGYLAPGGSHHETVGYGRRSRVGGRLTDRAGHPLSGQEVKVVEHFGSGALISRRVRRVKTNSRGRWGERIPAGPSRRITANYGGSSRYVSGQAKVGKLAVKTKVGLRVSRRRVPEGKRVLFAGRVRHYAARIPAGGKLVELQVKAGHGWDTVRHPIYTQPDGKYQMRYRFGRFYTSNVAYRFRVKALHEEGWAYKAPEKTRSRKLVVEAR